MGLKTFVGNLAKKSRLSYASLFLLISCSYLFQSRFGWLYLGKIAENYGDLTYILSRVDCTQSVGRQVYLLAEMQTECRNYIYGYPLLKVLKFFSINQKSNSVLGIFFMLAISLLFVILIKNQKSNTPKAIIFLLIFSPPIVLLVQRANLDLLIALMVFAGLLLHKKNMYVSTSVLLFASSAFKFYTLPVALSYLWIIRKRNIGYYLLVMSALGTIASVILDYKSLPFIPWDARNMFGNVIWGEYLEYLINGANSHSNFILSQLIGLLSIILMLWFFSLIKRKQPSLYSLFIYFRYKNDSGVTNYFLPIFLTCYFAGLNVDYRLIFLLIGLTAAGFGLSNNPIQNLFLFISYACIFFLSFNVNQIQVIGDFFLFIVVSRIIFCYAENVSPKLSIVFMYQSVERLRSKSLKRVFPRFRSSNIKLQVIQIIIIYYTWVFQIHKKRSIVYYYFISIEYIRVVQSITIWYIV